MKLDVRCFQFAARTRENADLARAHRHRAAPEQHVLQADPHTPEETVDFVVQRRLADLVDHADLQVVLQVLADAGHFMRHVHAGRAQRLAGADARKLEDLRRADRACAQDHFAARAQAGLARSAVVEKRQPGRAPGIVLVEQQMPRLRVGQHAQVLAPPRRAQIAHRSRAAPAAPRRQLEIARALLRRAVDVIVARNADLFGRINERVANRPVDPHVRDRDRPARAVVVVLAVFLVFRALEIGQHIGMGPAGVSKLAPVVVVLRLPTDVEQPVDRA